MIMRMFGVINISNQNVVINEERKVVPADGNLYQLPMHVALAYRNQLCVIPDFYIEGIKNKKDDAESRKEKMERAYKLINEENLNLKRETEYLIKIINKEKEKNIELTWKNNIKKKNKGQYIFDFLYSFHFDQEKERNIAIKRLRSSIKSIINQNVRICICNTSRKCIKDDIKDLGNIKYIHVPMYIKEGYCKPKTINLGVKNLVRSEYFYHSDIDLIYPPTFIKEMEKYIYHPNKVRVIFNNHNLGKDHFFKNFKDCEKNFNKFIDGTRTGKGIAPGNGLIHLKSFHKINGYDESYLGYGLEDADFNFRIGYINNYIEIDDKKVNTYHLFHEIFTKVELRNKNMIKYREKKNYIMSKILQTSFKEKTDLKYLKVNTD